VRQPKRKWRDTDDRRPNDAFSADPIADRAADDRARGDRKEKDEEVELAMPAPRRESAR
jgi:hypothetical protein